MKVLYSMGIRTAATLMLDNGADIHFIQQMLGHVSIGTTELYTHPTVHKKPDQESEPEATEEELLAALKTECDEDVRGE